MTPLHTYPRTRHIAGSGIQSGDDADAVVPLSELAGQHLVVEEMRASAPSQSETLVIAKRRDGFSAVLRSVQHDMICLNTSC